MESIRGKLVVSCQALPHEPLHSSFIMGRMALAAKEGGAAGIRANTPEDILEIRKNVDLPIIGIIKRDYPDSKIYITPTMAEVDALAEVKADIIAMGRQLLADPDVVNKARDGRYDQIRTCLRCGTCQSHRFINGAVRCSLFFIIYFQLL